MLGTRTPVVGRSAWRPRDFRNRDAYTVDLTDAQMRGLDAARAASRRRTDTTESITAEDFALGSLAADVAAWRDEVLHGRGFVVLRGLDRERYSEADLTAIFWGLGAHIGRAVSQSPMGDRIGHVTDVGGRDRRERAYRSSRELTLHTDRCDVIGMLCIEPAWRGGVSGYASVHTVHNDILASRPALLEPLFRGFRCHRRAEQLPGEPPITPERVPVLSECEGELSVVFLRAYIEMAAQELGEPLRDEDIAALDYFEEVARRPDVKLEFTLDAGEAIFFNNCTMLHNRTAFEDDPAGRRKRHLLRLWLMLDGRRPLAPAVHAYKGTQGIVGRGARSTYYTGVTLSEPA
jgi:Taurine catabolism dioxygenase TauD, TfdA family